MSIPSSLQQYHFHVILIWWHSPFNISESWSSAGVRAAGRQDPAEDQKRGDPDPGHCFTLMHVHSSIASPLDLSPPHHSSTIHLHSSTIPPLYTVPHSSPFLVHSHKLLSPRLFLNHHHKFLNLLKILQPCHTALTRPLVKYTPPPAL